MFTFYADVPKPYVIGALGLLRARIRFPDIVENIENQKQRMESLECPNALVKQEHCMELTER